MKLTLKNQELHIRFRYPNDTITECFVSERLEPKKYKILGHDRAYRNKIDDYNKHKGRRIALGRALIDAGLDRQQRQAAWQQYFSMTNDIVGHKTTNDGIASNPEENS